MVWFNNKYTWTFDKKAKYFENVVKFIKIWKFDLWNGNNVTSLEALNEKDDWFWNDFEDEQNECCLAFSCWCRFQLASISLCGSGSDHQVKPESHIQVNFLKVKFSMITQALNISPKVFHHSQLHV